ncbi:MAG: hypothetical protein K2M56_04250 [Muribaculaceae bacterium]|nr:hypothetical protein [Muribaculaceae bacterium]
MKKVLLLTSLLLAGIYPMFAEIEDDIYFNPKKAAHKSNQADNSSSSVNNYIANYQDMDVDEYNARGQYYLSPVDTIGQRTENEQDFVYTTQIQKFYNPTIVLDNEQLLADVLDNSYGNVTVEYNINGVPSFSGWWGPGFYTYPYYYNFPYYGYYGNTWGWNFGPLTGPYFSVGWGPAWGWNIAWNWGPSYWGPGYWGPSYWRPNYWGPSRPNYWASNRPGGNRPTGAAPGWSTHRPGIGNTAHRPGGNRPYTSPTLGNHSGNGNRPAGFGRQPGQGAYTTTRPGTSTGGNRYQSSGSTSRPGYTIGAGGHRVTGAGSTATPNRGTGSNAGSYRQPSTSGNSSVGAGRQPNSGAFQSTRPGSSNSGTSVRGNANSSSGRGGSSTYRSSGSSRTERSSGSNSGRSYNSNRSNSYNSNSGSSYNSGRSYNSGSYSTGGSRSYGGGFSGGGRSSSGGGGGRGGHR